MSCAEHIQRFEEAFRSPDPFGELYLLAVSLRDEGVSQMEIFALFAKFQDTTAGDDPRYDAIVDNMDVIYSGPWAKGRGIFPTELTEEQMKSYRG